MLNSINEKCARIRGAFVGQFDNYMAKSYCPLMNINKRACKSASSFIIITPIRWLQAASTRCRNRRG